MAERLGDAERMSAPTASNDAPGAVTSPRVEGAEAWIDAALAAAGRRRTGAIEQTRERPWSTVLRAPTDGGDVWLKACGTGTGAEAGLYGLLADAAPEYVLAPLAIDAPRGWVLLPDGGTTLENVSGDDADAMVRGLVDALPSYVAMQRALVPHVDGLLAVGVADMRPAALPGRFDEALAATEPYARRAGATDDADAHARIAALRPQIDAWSAELDATPFGATLDHNDLHGENVLVGGAVPRFYDFGDSVVAHPFTSALVPISFVRDHVLGGVGDEDPRVLTIRDAFLAPYAAEQEVDVEALVPMLELACRLAKIARTLVWQRALDGYGPGRAPEQWAGAPLATLSTLLGDSPYGGA